MNLLVNIDVDDLDAAIRFYTVAFDLKIARSFGADGVEMSGAAAPIFLLVKLAGSRASSAAMQTRSYERHWTPVHLDFVVDDIEAATKKAASAGARIENAIATHKWGRIAHLADPFGHGFCLVEFLGKGYDEIAQPESAYSS